MKPQLIPAAVLLPLLLLFAAGCSKTGVNGSGQPAKMLSKDAVLQKPITEPETFQELYKDWTARLEDIDIKTEDAYAGFNGNKIDRDTFIEQLDSISKVMKSLNIETDSRADFELSDKDKQAVNYQDVTAAYQQASKGLNDFLYFAPHLKSDQLRAKHDELITGKYQSGIGKLKILLKI